MFARVADVTRVVAMTSAGSYGVLPHRLDFACVLVAGLLSYATASGGDVHIAVDGGVMVKTGAKLAVCVQHAIAAADLGALRAAVDREFLNLSEDEKSIRGTLAQLESGLIRRLLELRRG